MDQLHHLGHQEQEEVLRQAEQAVLTVEGRNQLRHLVSQDQVGMVLLGKLVYARTICREKIALLPLEKGQEIVQQAIKLQGQLQGIDLAIDVIFDICNFEIEEQPDDDTEQPNPSGYAGGIAAGF